MFSDTVEVFNKGGGEMPGVLHHLYFAEEVFKHVPTGKATIQKVDFYLGNVLPDLSVDKEKTHFKTESRIAKGFKVPELFWAKKQLEPMENRSLRLGAYAHLFLDKKFIEGFVYPRFDFNWEKDEIVDHRTRRKYTTDKFFSPKGLYHGYSELNRIILSRDLVDVAYLSSLPAWPEKTGLETFDNFREESWREELNRYLLNLTQTRGKVFLANDFVKFIKETAVHFVRYEMTEYF